MIVIGITGSIGMGKSTVADQFRQLGAKIFSADSRVHALLKTDKKIISEIEKIFPESIVRNKLDRKKLGDMVFFDAKKRGQLEQILHPKIAMEGILFAKNQQKIGTKIIVLDIPLLFETGASERCDLALVVTAPAFIQEQRVLSRTGMTKEKYKNILETQMSDEEKQLRADYVIETGLGKAHSFRQVKHIMEALYDA